MAPRFERFVVTQLACVCKAPRPWLSLLFVLAMRLVYTFHKPPIKNHFTDRALDRHGLGDAAEVLVGGDSAGGLAALWSVDWWGRRLPHARVAAVPDSGFFSSFHGSKRSGNIFGVGVFLDFVRRSGATRAEGPHGARVRRAKRSRVDRHARIILPLLFRHRGGSVARLEPRGESVCWWVTTAAVAICTGCERLKPFNFSWLTNRTGIL